MVGPYKGEYSGGRGYGGDTSRGSIREGYNVLSKAVLSHYPGRPHYYYTYSLPQRPYNIRDDKA